MAAYFTTLFRIQIQNKQRRLAGCLMNLKVLQSLCVHKFTRHANAVYTRSEHNFILHVKLSYMFRLMTVAIIRLITEIQKNEMFTQLPE